MDDVELRFDGAWIKLAALTPNFLIFFSLWFLTSFFLASEWVRGVAESLGLR